MVTDLGGTQGRSTEIWRPIVIIFTENLLCDRQCVWQFVYIIFDPHGIPTRLNLQR
jgi:hypothetical protein